MELKNLQENYCKTLNRLKCLRNKVFHLIRDNDSAVEHKEELEKRLEMQISKRFVVYCNI